jgi:hypothetical protein
VVERLARPKKWFGAFSVIHIAYRQTRRQTATAHQAGGRKSKLLMRCSLKLLVLMRISTSLPDGKWREVAEAARAFEELGI